MVGAGAFASAGALLTAFVVKAQLAGAVTPPDQVTRALASFSSSSSECFAEAGACLDDATCGACATGYGDQLEACTASLSISSHRITDVDVFCESYQDLLCCGIGACVDNAAYVALFDCTQEVIHEECGLFDLSACTAGGDFGSDEATTGDRGISTSDSTTGMDDASSTTLECPVEQEACFDDTACLSCAETISELVETCQGPDYDRETATCSEKLELRCCYFEDRPECLSDDLVVKWADCEADADGCAFSITECADGGGSSAILGGDDDTPSTESDGDGSTSDSTGAIDNTSSTTLECPVEQEACFDDTACFSCAETISELVETCQGLGYDRDTATCSEKLELRCCYFEDRPECLSDDLVVKWADCEADADGCSFSITECADGGNSFADAVGADADSATPFSMVGGTTTLIVAAVVSWALISA